MQFYLFDISSDFILFVRIWTVLSSFYLTVFNHMYSSLYIHILDLYCFMLYFSQFFQFIRILKSFSFIWCCVLFSISWCFWFIFGNENDCWNLEASEYLKPKILYSVSSQQGYDSCAVPTKISVSDNTHITNMCVCVCACESNLS